MVSSILVALSITSFMKTILFLLSRFRVIPTRNGVKKDYDELEQNHQKIFNNERCQNGDDGVINSFVSKKQPASDDILQKGLVIPMQPCPNVQVFCTLRGGEPLSCLLGRVTINRGCWKQDYMKLKIMSSSRSIEANELEPKYQDYGFNMVKIISGDANQWDNAWILSVRGRNLSAKQFSEDSICKVNPTLYRTAMAISSDFGLKMGHHRGEFCNFLFPALSKFPNNTIWGKGWFECKTSVHGSYQTYDLLVFFCITSGQV
ncbi:hypothetical protein U1Q18_025188 [Sarracenia purpurea var. burkii]